MRRLFTFWLLFASLPVALPARELTDYRIGDTVEEDIVTPVPLDVIDPDATAARKEQESLTTPAIFRYYPDTTNEVEARFIGALRDVRAFFLAEAALTFRQMPIDEPTRASVRFSEFVAVFDSRNKSLPVTTDMAEAWASGDDGLAIQTALVARLRQAMRRHIRTDDLPGGLVLGETLRLVPVASPDETPALEVAQRRGRIVTRTSVATLSRARELLRREFPDNEQVLGSQVAAFLKPDCVLDEVLTRQARARQVEQLAVADHFDAGQVVARRAQVIDKKLRAAIEQLHTRTAVGRLTQQVAVERGLAQRIRHHNLLLLAALAGVSLVSGLTVWQLARRRPEASPLPALAGVGAVAAGTPAGDDSWRQRALDAESRAEKAYAMMRDNLAPHLAQTLKEAVVQGLASQRKELLAAQHQAAQEVNELVRRLDELQTPVRDRLRAYERRIEDLEKALAAKSEEYQELLKLKIEMTRRQAEAERARKQPESN